MIRNCGRLLGKKKIEKEEIFHLFGRWTGNSGLLTNSFQRGCQTFLIRVHRIALKERFFEQNICILRYSYRKRTLLAFRWIFFWRGCQNCIPGVEKNILRKKISLKKIISSFHRFFLHCGKTVWPSGKTFLTDFCLNCSLHVHENILRKKNQKSKSFFLFWGFWAKFFLWKFFRRGCEICILRVHKNLFREKS